jgi:hypothetical protein
MVYVEREDFEESFVTILRFVNGNKGQEISVYAWEADAIESALQSLSLAQVMALYNRVGKSVIKDWSD